MKLVEVFSENLGIYSEDAAGRFFVCPLCGLGAEYKTDSDFDRKVSLAHVFPKALGGRLCVVASTEMNNKLGTMFENHMVMDAKHQDWVQGTTQRNVNLEIDGKRMGVMASIKKGSGWDFWVIEKQTDPEAKEIFRKALSRSSGEHFEFQIKFNQANPMRKAIAYVHCAFLLAFRYFAYEYALAPFAAEIRNLWMNPDFGDTKLTRAVISMGNLPVDKHPKDYAIGCVTSGPAKGLLMAVMPKFDRLERKKAVLMPGFEENAWDKYVHFLEQSKEGLDLAVTFLKMPGFENLREKKMKFYGHKCWHDLLS